MLGKALKYGGLALGGWVVATNAWPAISDAWKTRQAAVEVAAQSTGLTRSEVANKYIAAIQKRGVKTVTIADIEATKEGDKWVLSADFEVPRRLYGTTSLIYEFSVASDRRTLWVTN